MKNVITIIAILFSFATSAQKIQIGASKEPAIFLKNDTLNVKPGACKFIKVGDKIYELKTSIQEVEKQPVFQSSLTWPQNLSPATYYIEDTESKKPQQ